MSLSSQEDLSIKKYSQIGCLILKSDKKFIVNNIQENSLLSYQTFSSSHMTIELCFRLCRRWTILMFNNQTNCICLYTINEPYEFNEYLGEFLPINNCTSNDIKIYSLTNDLYILPTLLSSTSDDWSLDGCYYLYGIQTIRVDLWLSDVDYIQAMDLCQKHCRKNRRINYFSFFLSRKKSCYCVPVKISQTIKPIALRKPLIHCSFLPYICHGFSNLCEKYYSKTNIDTLIKIDVQHYCSTLNSISFVFDRTFYMCFTSILLQTEMDFSITSNEHKCLPLVIKTYEQWNYLIESSWITHIKTFIWINHNSTYIFDDLLKSENLTSLSNNFCMIIIRTESNNISYELIQCNAVQLPGYILCAQKPFESAISYEEEFKMTNNESELIVDEILSCPSEFVLFNKICYYVHSSFIYNIRSGERLCYNQHPNSTLVKYDSHEWGNINATRFLGRTLADILIEFFYYLLENKLLIESIDASNRKHWLRLLFGDRNDPNECVLRYFARLTGSFTTFYHCNNGGHPVCQCEPIRTIIPKIIPIDETISHIRNSQTENKTESIDITSTTQIIVVNSTDMLILSNKTSLSLCENCTTNTLANESLVNNNHTEINSTSYNDALLGIPDGQFKMNYSNYQPLIVILTGPILAFAILIVGIALLIHHVRGTHESFSTNSSIVGTRRTKRSSTMMTTSDFPSTSGALYARFKPSGLPFSEIDTFIPVDNSTPNEYNMELLPTLKVQVTDGENKIKEDDEEFFYATLK
ncbi:unnamed protein product [Rotaria sp. Silwood1]|nr:unnamed protein product [Rotaria sp. Silwood1]